MVVKRIKFMVGLIKLITTKKHIVKTNQLLKEHNLFVLILIFCLTFSDRPARTEPLTSPGLPLARLVLLSHRRMLFVMLEHDGGHSHRPAVDGLSWYPRYYFPDLVGTRSDQ